MNVHLGETEPWPVCEICLCSISGLNEGISEGRPGSSGWGCGQGPRDGPALCRARFCPQLSSKTSAFAVQAAAFPGKAPSALLGAAHTVVWREGLVPALGLAQVGLLQHTRQAHGSVLSGLCGNKRDLFTFFKKHSVPLPPGSVLAVCPPGSPVTHPALCPGGCPCGGQQQEFRSRKE